MDRKDRFVASPPPYVYQDDASANADTSLTIYASATLQPSASSSSHIAQVLSVRSSQSGIERYSISIPKKREGWKAEIAFITEKQQRKLRYEVRREPLARRYDFRDPEGNHNVMIPSHHLSGKSFLIETPDGQRLMWRRAGHGWELVSMPSQTIIARYTSAGSHSGHQQPLQANESGFHVMGGLSVMDLPAETEPVPFSKEHRSNSQTSIASSSSSGGPRLGRAYQRCSIGLCVPAAICAAIASPHAATSMSRNSVIGDELANLGRAILKPISRIQQINQDYQTAGSSWLQMNQPSVIRKNSDPRPRKVDLDLIISSFVAVLAG